MLEDTNTYGSKIEENNAMYIKIESPKRIHKRSRSASRKELFIIIPETEYDEPTAHNLAFIDDQDQESANVEP